MYRNRKCNNQCYSYISVPSDNGVLLPFDDIDVFHGIDWTPKAPRSQIPQLSYDSEERIGVIYDTVTLTSPIHELVAGLRAGHTNQLYTMLQRFETTGSLGEQSYWDYLPPVSFHRAFRDRTNLRFSYYKSISRPGFYELVSYQADGEDYAEKGNPLLKYARIDNLGLCWEQLPSQDEQVLLGVFYKHLKDPIETTFDVDQRQSNASYYMSQNPGSARSYGAELDVIECICHSGFKANYTYTHSAITIAKERYTAENQVEYVDQARPLISQASHATDLFLFYKDTQHGRNGQLVATYTGTQLVSISPYYDSNGWEKHLFLPDLGGEKCFSNGISLFVETNNLLNSERERYLKTINELNTKIPGQPNNRIIIGAYKHGRISLAGVRVNL